MPDETCSVCGAPATGQCAWPTQKPTTVDWRDIRHGDAWLREDGLMGHVVEITAAGGTDRLTFRVTFPNLKTKEYTRGGMNKNDTRLPVRTLRPGVCGAPVCDRHTRELNGDGSGCCPNHWRAWQEVA